VEYLNINPNGLTSRDRFDNLFTTKIGMNVFKNSKTLGVAVEQVRRRQGATQIQLAQMANVGVRFVRDLEDGKETVQMNKVMKVLAVLGIELAYDLPPGSKDI